MGGDTTPTSAERDDGRLSRIGRRLVVALGPTVALGGFVAALVVLRGELHHYTYHQIVQSLRGIPYDRLALAVVLTACSFFTLTLYDLMAVRYVGRRQPYRRIALASFLGYAFSNSVGFSALSGGPIRYRVYSSARFSALDVAKIMAFCTVTLWLGFAAVGSLVFLLFPFSLPPSLHVPLLLSSRPLGIAFLIPVLGYLSLSAVRKGTLTIKGWEVPLPSPRLAMIQLLTASADWIAAASVLYVLLPEGSRLSFPGFLGAFLFAQVAGIISQVPGGLGVFETAMVLLIAPTVPAAALLASLVAYRGIYYLLPLVIAALTLAGREVVERREGVRRAARVLGRAVPWLAPNLLAFTTFVGGVILLVSGATPGIRGRMAWLNDILPLPIIEASHFLGSLAGAALLILARGLQRRLDAAYHLTLGVLGAGIAFSLLKGGDYEEAGILTLMLLALLPSRRHFYRKASLFGESFTLPWVVAIGLVLFAVVWMGLFAYQHVEYSGELWWRFAWEAGAPRFLRAWVGVAGLMLLVGLARLLRASASEPEVGSPADVERARPIVETAAGASANLAFLNDKAFLFSDSGQSFVMYGVEKRSWIAMGDPVGPREERVELVWRFRELSARHGGWTVFYEVGKENIDLYLELGLSLLKLGEEARVHLGDFSLSGKGRKGLRYQYNRLDKEGCTFQVLPAEETPAAMAELQAVSDAWLQDKGAREKGFSLGRFDPDYLRRFPTALVRDRGRVVAFANLWRSGAREELSVDLMRHLPDGPPGVMDFLFVSLLLWGKEQGYEWFNLGMAPLAGLPQRQLAPVWSRLGGLLYRHGEHFYNFQGLRAYKDKFDPHWEPRYLASPGGLALPIIVGNLASLISGSVVGALGR